MLNKLIQSFKIEVKLKDVAIWFALSFIGVLIIYLYIVKRAFDTSLLMETFGFAAVFVLMMIGTKCYGHFVDGYYQSYIDRHNEKHQTKRSKKKR